MINEVSSIKCSELTLINTMKKKKTTVGNSEIIKKWKLTKEVCKIFKFLNYIVNSVY